jgi:two-component system, LuxR family, sensor kinase FixL
LTKKHLLPHMLVGFTKNEAIGQKAHKLLKTKSVQPLESIEAALQQDGKRVGELIHQTKLGRELYIQSYWLAKFGKNHRIMEIFESNVDVTERKSSERLAAIGATAGMVGHDIRNPLQTITGEVFLARDALKKLPDTPFKGNMVESLDIIDEQMTYVNKIVSDLQDYAKPLYPKLEEVDLRCIVETVLMSINHSQTYAVNTLTSIFQFKMIPVYCQLIKPICSGSSRI